MTPATSLFSLFQPERISRKKKARKFFFSLSPLATSPLSSDKTDKLPPKEKSIFELKSFSFWSFQVKRTNRRRSAGGVEAKTPAGRLWRSFFSISFDFIDFMISMQKEPKKEKNWKFFHYLIEGSLSGTAMRADYFAEFSPFYCSWLNHRNFRLSPAPQKTVTNRHKFSPPHQPFTPLDS
jgi:hypothetical protein